MSLIVNKDRVWNAKLDIEGSEVSYELFDSMEYGLILKTAFIDALRNLNEMYEHYKFSDCLRELFTPEGEDFTEYAVFMLLCRLSPETDQPPISRIYLFALRKDNNIQLLAANDDELTVEKFSSDLDKIILYPDNVESLLIAYAPIPKIEE